MREHDPGEGIDLGQSFDPEGWPVPAPVPPETSRRMVGCRFPVALWEQFRAAAWAERKSATRALEELIAVYVARAQKQHNGGEPFEPLPLR